MTHIRRILTALLLLATAFPAAASEYNGRAYSLHTLDYRVAETLVGVFEALDPGDPRHSATAAEDVLARGAERIDRELRDQPLGRARLKTTGLEPGIYTLRVTAEAAGRALSSATRFRVSGRKACALLHGTTAKPASPRRDALRTRASTGDGPPARIASVRSGVVGIEDTIHGG